SSLYHSLHPSGIPPLLPIPLSTPSTSRGAGIPDADTPPWNRPLLATPRPGCEVGESSAAAASRPKPTMAHGVDCSYVETRLRDTERRMMAALELVNLRVSYQVDVCTRESSEFCTRHHDAQKDRTTVRAEIKVLRSERLAYEQEGIQTREALRQAADDFAVQHIMRTQALEAGARSRRLIMDRTRRRQTPPPTNPNNMTPKAMQTMIDQALLRNSGGKDGSHSSHAENPRNMHTARPCYYADFKKCHPLNFKGTEGAVGLTCWIEKMESFISNETEKVDKYISGLLDNIYGNVKSSKPKTLDETIEMANDLMDQKLRTYAERKSNGKRKADDISRNNQQPFKKQNVTKAYNLGSAEKKTYEGNAPKCTKCQRNHYGPCTLKCHKRGKIGHYACDCRSTGNTNATNNRGERNGNAAGNPDSNVVTELGSFDAIIGMDWLRRHHAVIVCDEKLVRVTFGNEALVFRRAESYIGRESRLTVISCSKVQEYRAKGCHVFLAQISATKEDDKPERKQVKDVPIVQDFPEVFLENLPGLPPARPVEFQIDLIPEAAPVARAPYRLAPSEMKELSEQLQELSDKGFIR
nr:reverse transcriptase domain-containing protein [Tanacetum cinerariifolium]